jgi:tetratricopeptide (TPR) repeat protein
VAPTFDFVHRDLVAHLRRTDDRLGAAAVAHDVVQRYGGSVEAWMLLGECYVAAYRPRDAVAAFEEVLVIEERADAAMAAAGMYSQVGDHATAGARYARAYAAGAGPKALRLNALELQAAGDATAAAQARMLWEKETGKKWDSAAAAG